MRKQYHFRPTDAGLMAWDVERLIVLSKSLPRTTVALSSIREIDEVYWFDDAKERPTCRRVLEHMSLINEVDLSYPIILGADGRVMDGMHRVARRNRFIPAAPGWLERREGIRTKKDLR